VTTGQFAQRHGRQAAVNLVRVLNGETTQPFRFRALGELCSIGGYEAVAEMFGVRVSGVLAWLLWRGVYLFKLPTWSRRFKVGFDWSWDFVFPRDLSFLSSDTARPFTHAYYRKGDFIQRQGDPARFFSIIEEGEVEVLVSETAGTGEKIVAVLSKNDFFGNEALLENRPHQTSIRARTEVRLRQGSSTLFSEMIGSFAPLREMLANAVTRNSGELWRRLPQARTLLDREPLASFLDPLPGSPLTSNVSLGDAVKSLRESAGELIILDEKNHLWGKLDRRDLYQLVARVSIIPPEQRVNLSERKLTDFLVPDPLCISLQDSPFIAAGTMLKHGIAWLPVVRSAEDAVPVGYVRQERIVDFMLHKVAGANEDIPNLKPTPTDKPLKSRAESA
jgi:NADH dehydrogenase